MLETWANTTERAQQLASAAGKGYAFEAMLDQLRAIAKTRNTRGLDPLLSSRLAARALTWLWLNQPDLSSILFSERQLNALVEQQKPRFTRITLFQLVQLYFRQFDLIDQWSNQGARGRERLEQVLRAQLELLPARDRNREEDAIRKIKAASGWLITSDGPRALATRVRAKGGELAPAMHELGLAGLDTGRYADVCRAQFYLQRLAELPPGVWDDVLSELLKPSVNTAPYGGDKLVGHAALEILIDKIDGEPGEKWQSFILGVAGDPRIASSARNYQRWWRPLGEDRIAKVRGWLSKADLKLFLQAVEEFGRQHNNDELKRMFPARKRFLEGLDDLGLIRTTRLMLGARAETAISRILDSEVTTSFAKLPDMSEKAVIYLDCGEFHIIEGSHSFRIWTYLAPPSRSLTTYDRSTFSHRDLVKAIPREYEEANASLEYSSVVHNNRWQYNVLSFLADNGIQIEYENLFSKTDYQHFKRAFGLPRVRRGRKHRAIPQARTHADIANVIRGLGKIDTDILTFLMRAPGSRAKDVAGALGVSPTDVNRRLYGNLRTMCEQDARHRWTLFDSTCEALYELARDG